MWHITVVINWSILIHRTGTPMQTTTPWNSAFLQKPPILQLLTNFSNTLRNPKVHYCFQEPYTVVCSDSHQFSSYQIPLRSISILYTHLRQGLQVHTHIEAKLRFNAIQHKLQCCFYISFLTGVVSVL
jgi:hypothetical protein